MSCQCDQPNTIPPKPASNSGYTPPCTDEVTVDNPDSGQDRPYGIGNHGELKCEVEEARRQEAMKKRHQEESRKHQEESKKEQEEIERRHQEESKKHQEEIQKNKEALVRLKAAAAIEQEKMKKRHQEELRKEQEEIERKHPEESKKGQEEIKKKPETLARLKEEAERHQEETKKHQEESSPPITHTAHHPTAYANEAIMFFGNPGVGKSTLCNAIFGRAIFLSGASMGSGLTSVHQVHMHEGRLCIDTPGLEDILKREQAAAEIEKALKYDKNYKIVFVATLENGRIRIGDIVTVNLVCDALRDVPFEYGIIFNQIPSRIYQKAEQEFENPELVTKYFRLLHKMPAGYVILEKDDDIEGADNVVFEKNHVNMQRLTHFLNGLPSKPIHASAVHRIEIVRYEESCNQMEIALKNKTANAPSGVVRSQEARMAHSQESMGRYTKIMNEQQEELHDVVIGGGVCKIS
eukprot:gene296-385_t